VAALWKVFRHVASFPCVAYFFQCFFRVISTNQGQQLANDLKVSYIECSSKSGDNIGIHVSFDVMS
jgi:hypothetical protein